MLTEDASKDLFFLSGSNDIKTITTTTIIRETKIECEIHATLHN